MQDNENHSETTGLEIAIIGIAGKFPGANNIDEFWENIKNGIETIHFFTPDELIEVGVNEQLIDNPNYVKAKGFFEGRHFFDSTFFNYTPAEAKLMDPQLRIYHEYVWTAIENAGCNPDIYPGPIGIYSGASPSRGWISEALRKFDKPSQQFDVLSLNNNSSFGTRISYNLNLNGPSITVQTACSTSLVAIHLACQGLLNAECDIAIAGGVSLETNHQRGYLYQEGMINSPDGHCRPFDAQSQGTLSGEGVGVVVLKRLTEAIEEHDYIYAVIKGTAINNDGNRKVNYTAPSVEGQAEVIRAALEVAEIEPESISYIETHGTGTALGDPIEIEGLKLAFNTDKSHFCGLGSVKSNIGHLDNASGITGFIKTVLALNHRLIPPSLHFNSPNPKINFENSPFYVNTKLREWESGQYPRRAGVSSFGIGGTNAHVILEEAPTNNNSNSNTSKSRQQQLILLSAKTKKSIEQMKKNISNYLSLHPDCSLPDVAYTLKLGRRNFKHRGFTIGYRHDEIIKNLSTENPEEFQLYSSLEENRPVIFMFPGQGSQYENMGLELYQSEPQFRDTMDNCFEILKSLTDHDFKEIIFPGNANNNKEQNLTQIEKSKLIINQTEFVQPLMFSFEYALAQLLIAWGIEPSAMIGHSIGEYVAATLSNVLTLEDALNLVALRGRLMQQLPTGSMLGVSITEEELLPLLQLEEKNALSLAAVNSPTNCVVSGPHEAVHAFELQLKEKYQTRPLHTSHAFHSQMLNPILDEFENNVKKITFASPEIPFISNLTGKWYSPDQTASSKYWRDHLRNTVRFSDGIVELLKKEGKAVLVEVGPGKVLSILARQHQSMLSDKKNEFFAVNLIRHPNEQKTDDHHLLEKIGQLWQRGVNINWENYYADETRYKVPLPTYPFERHFFGTKGTVTDDTSTVASVENQNSLQDLNVKNTNISDWFYIPSWKGTRIPTDNSIQMPSDTLVLVFISENSISRYVLDWLKEKQKKVVSVKQSLHFNKLNDYEFAINPEIEENYDLLMEGMNLSGTNSIKIIHLWNTNETQKEALFEDIDRILINGYYSLLYLARSIGRKKVNTPIEIEVITNNLHDVTGIENTQPEKAIILGPTAIIPREYNNIVCRNIDVQPLSSNNESEVNKLITHLFRELFSNYSDTIVALRGNKRWVQEYETYSIPSTNSTRIKKGGVYLITGGLGGMGLLFAEELSKKWQAKLILIDQLELPPQNQWESWLENNKENSDNRIISKIKSLQNIEKLGGEITVFKGDIQDLNSMKDIIQQVQQKYTNINGVIHTAGIPDGGLIQSRSLEQSETVFAPKIKGTLVLEHVLKPFQLDFFFLCSSISSILSPLGQVAYCSANNFLDFFAQKKTEQGIFTLAVNWDSWQKIGMAAEASDQNSTEEPVTAHPLLHNISMKDSNKIIFKTELSPEKYWVLNEHRIKGKATLPGTAYIEIARAAFQYITNKKQYEINDLYFLAPLTIEEDETRIMHITLEKDETPDRYLFQITSFIGNKWQEHAKGKIFPIDTQNIHNQSHNLNELKEQFKNENSVPNRTQSNEQSISFGPRWNHVKNLSYGIQEGLARLELDSAFHTDLDNYKLHPALMDTATSFLRGMNQDTKLFLPFYVKKIQILDSDTLSPQIYSYSQSVDKTANPSNKQSLEYNISIMNDSGNHLIEIQGFTLIQVSSITQPHQSTEEKKLPVSPTELGILPIEGIEVFNRLLTQSQPQVIVSTTNFINRLSAHKAKTKTAFSALQTSAENTQNEEDLHPRPELSTPYLAATNQTQQHLIDIWQGFLGIGEIGILDDFFEIGGDSLKGLTMISEIQKHFKVTLSIPELFNAPTIKELSQILESTQINNYSAILPTEKKEYYPLSSAQKRLYFQQQLKPESLLYNIPYSMTIKGKLNLELFEKAFHSLIQRHESIRTTFHFVNGQAIQIVHPTSELGSIVKFKEINNNSKENIQILRKEFYRPFDLTQAPLMRVEIVKVNDDEYLWLFDIHHIIADATGIAIIHNEIFKIYKEKELSPLNIQYKDFSNWQNNLLDNGSFQKQEDYWKKVFADGVPKTNIPTDYPRPETTTYQGDMYLFKLEKETTQKFIEVGNSVKATIFMNLMASLNILLLKYTGQEDFVIGSTIAGRQHAELWNIVGMFVNILAIRNFPQPNLTYIEFLNSVKSNILKAFENQDLQFETLVELINPSKNATKNPLFDICLNVQNYEQTTWEISDLSFTPSEVEYKSAKFDMLLWANHIGEEFHFMLEYSTELFKPSTAEDFSKHFKEILIQVSENKNIKLEDIQISHQVFKPSSSVPQIDFDF